MELSKNYLVKEVPNRPAQTERGPQWFKTSFRLPDNSTTNSYSLIPNKEEWSYRRRTIWTIQQNPISFLYKYWTAWKVDNNATFTVDLSTKTNILMVVQLNRAMIVLYQGVCYIKDVRIYIVIWIINNNVATEITRLQKNIVVLENLAPSENLALPCSSPPW